MNRRLTLRGFTLYEFTDLYGAKCSLQKSSLATEHAIWLGVDEPPPDTDHTQVCGGCSEQWPCRVQVVLARLEMAEAQQRQRMIEAGVCP